MAGSHWKQHTRPTNLFASFQIQGFKLLQVSLIYSKQSQNAHHFFGKTNMDKQQISWHLGGDILGPIVWLNLHPKKPKHVELLVSYKLRKIASSQQQKLQHKLCTWDSDRFGSWQVGHLRVWTLDLGGLSYICCKRSRNKGYFTGSRYINMFIQVYSTLWLNEVQPCSILAHIFWNNSSPAAPPKKIWPTAGHIKMSCLKARGGWNNVSRHQPGFWGSWLPKWVDLGPNLMIHLGHDWFPGTQSSISPPKKTPKHLIFDMIWSKCVAMFFWLFVCFFFRDLFIAPNSIKPRGALWRSCRPHCFVMNSPQMTRYLIPISIQMDTIAYVVKWNCHQLAVTTSWKEMEGFPTSNCW